MTIGSSVLLLSVNGQAEAEEAQYAQYQPYPQPGYGPPTYGPSPGQGPPAQGPAYYEGGPPLVFYGWDPDVPPPAGYALRTNANGSLIGYGLTMFSIGYVTSAVIGLVAVQDARNGGSGGSDWTPMFVPAIGPFVAIGTLNPNAAGTGLLLADGLFQAAGVIAVIVGAIDTRHKIVRTDVGSNRTDDPVRIDIAPLVGQTKGLQSTVTF